jgi:hypothetical protein
MYIYDKLKSIIKKSTSWLPYANDISIEEKIRRFKNYDKLDKLTIDSSDIVSDVITNRYRYARQIKPLAKSIDIVSSMVAQTPVNLKSKDDVVQENVIEQFFLNDGSLLHATYNDFIISFQREMQINGVVYLLAELNGESIIRLDVVPSNYVVPMSTTTYRGIITDYMITNFLDITQKRVSLNYKTKYYESFEKDYILFCTDIAFEDYSSGASRNLSLSPLLAIARELHMYNNAIMRSISLNRQGSSGGILTVNTSFGDPEKQEQLKTKFENSTQGAINHGHVDVVMTQKNIGSTNDIQYSKIGNTAQDYDIPNDLSTSESLIYENFCISASFAKQEAKYVGNQAESLRQLYSSKIFPEINKMYVTLKQWLFPFFSLDPKEFFYQIDTSAIDVFMQTQVAFIQTVGDVLDRNEKRALLHYEPQDLPPQQNNIDQFTTDNTDLQKALKFLTDDN